MVDVINRLENHKVLHVPSGNSLDFNRDMNISGTLGLGSNRITNVANPIDASDVATKAYADSVSGVTTGSWVTNFITETGSFVANQTGDSLIFSGVGINVGVNGEAIVISGTDLNSSYTALSGAYVATSGATTALSGALYGVSGAAYAVSGGLIALSGVVYDISGTGTITGSVWLGSLWHADEAQGDIIYRDADRWTRLAAGGVGSILMTSGAGADPFWGAGVSGPQGPAGETNTSLLIGTIVDTGITEDSKYFPLNLSTENVTTYITEAWTQNPMSKAGSIRNLIGDIESSTLAGSVALMVRKNGADTDLMVIWSSGTTTSQGIGSNFADYVLFEPGDLLNMLWSGAAQAGAATYLRWSMEVL